MQNFIRISAAFIFVCSLAVVEASDCFRTSVGFVPLMDGVGLYPSGQNTAPVLHIQAGQARATVLKSRAKLVLMSVGMSNTNAWFEGFRRKEWLTTDKAANVYIVNGASGKQVAFHWADPNGAHVNNHAYQIADERLAVQGLIPADVGVLWIDVTNAANGSYDVWRATMKNDVRKALKALVIHYPNVKQIFLSSMAYGGYGQPIGGLHPEPHSYQHGVVMRELITEHLAGTLLPAQWIAWGPDLWADGLVPRSDGLTWLCSDFVNDGCHPTNQGGYKVAGILANFFRTDPVANMWFLGTGSTPQPAPGRISKD